MLLLYFFFTFFVSLLLTPLVALFMQKIGIVDRPTQTRKIHKKNIPLAGGLAIFLTFFIFIFWALFFGKNIGSDITSHHIWGIFFGSLILMVGGLLDDKYTLSPAQQIWFPLLACIVILGFGIGLESITSPFGGALFLDTFSFSLFGLGNFLVLADILVFFGS